MANTQVELREATLDDLTLLRHWDRQPHVIASDPDDDWDWEVELGKHPQWREQLIAEVDGRPIGMLQIINAAEEESHYWGDVAEDVAAIDIWIGEADYLGQGYGTQMMQLAIARCFADPTIHRIFVDPLASNVGAHRFYERLGFEFVEERSFDGIQCFVYQLVQDEKHQRI